MEKEKNNTQPLDEEALEQAVGGVAIPTSQEDRITLEIPEVPSHSSSATPCFI